MYQVTIKGKNLKELKSAVSDINNELNNGTTVVSGMTKDMGKVIVDECPENIAEIVPPALVENVNVPAVMQNPSETDVEGISWDLRIHTEKKTKTAKGIWKLKRGIDQAIVAQVKAEQLGSSPAPVAVVVAPVVAAPVAPLAVVETPLVHAPAVEVAPVVTPAIPTMGSGHSVETFTANFPMVVAGLITEGKVTQEYINTLKGHFNVTEIWLITDAQKAEVFAGFVQAKIIQQVG